jgi:hemerythrin-like metal-binding protein
MALVDWNKDLSVGVAQFDKDHKKLVEILNSLHDAMKEGKGKDKLQSLVDQMFQYAAQHLATEEKLMVKYHYPDYVSHKKEHDAFVKEVTTFKEQLDNGKILISSKVTQFLKDWLVNHICCCDKKYGPFFSSALK